MNDIPQRLAESLAQRLIPADIPSWIPTDRLPELLAGLAVLVILLAIWRRFSERRKIKQLNRFLHEHHRKGNGDGFEDACATLFRKMGYKVKRVGKSGDFGADLIVRRRGKTSIVQCKDWAQNVGVRAIQEAFTAKSYYRGDRAIVVVRRDFTKAGRDMAETCGVELISGDMLRDLVAKHVR
ncbi:hypothetical protein CKO28_21940 [Rhodovibrio sodomensis]|uniref:Restriction endonuclease type IV Mrr domain-containing protein n=1 Tax=Rhodovibrio sodomensis TaxID=1088 RepID=A0ABS1DMT3_9PROT|nr:restriction endonuclease [Rhodovibrio sodomensis]MBK1670685.1 hypothetical protein [Rhodovibrio sodomensis]